MPRLKEFRFRWMDAWFHIDRGYYSELRYLANGEASIDVLVNKKPFVIDLTGLEDAFIQDLEDIGIIEWDKKYYVSYDYCDGDMWALSVAWDSHQICAQGTNGYPASFPRFLELLHVKYHLPKADIERAFGLMKLNSKGLQIKEMNDPENTFFYFKHS